MNEQQSVPQPFFGAQTDNVNYANLCVLGISWDQSSTYRTGAHKSPDVIRYATSGELFNPYTELGMNIQEHWQIFDVGNALVNEVGVTDAKAFVREKIKKYNTYGMKFFFLGGDHLTTYFTFSALKELNDKRLGLVYVDAHPDLYDQYKDNKYTHASVVRRIIDETNIEPETIIQVGIRASTREQQEYANSIGIKTISTNDFRTSSPEQIAEQVKSSLPKFLDGYYLSIDMDVLDPAYAPGVGNPQPGGLSTRDILRFIHALRGTKLYSFDIVELSPQVDYSGITAFAAAKIIQEVIGILPQ